MWQKSNNSEYVRPLEVERSGNNVIVRQSIKPVEATEDMPAHYAWEEMQLTADQYEVYQQFEQRIKENEDALVELAELISGGM